MPQSEKKWLLGTLKTITNRASDGSAQGFWTNRGPWTHSSASQAPCRVPKVCAHRTVLLLRKSGMCLMTHPHPRSGSHAARTTMRPRHCCVEAKSSLAVDQAGRQDASGILENPQQTEHLKASRMALGERVEQVAVCRSLKCNSAR